MSARGAFVDRATQLWVRATGRQVRWDEHPWLEAPVGDADTIGGRFFERLADRRGWNVRAGVGGLLESIGALDGPTCRVSALDREVAAFYEQTSAYELDVWSQWSRLFRPFGGLVAAIFSRRLQQLNLPLSGLETSLGIRSQVLKLDPVDGGVALTAWIRQTIATGATLYAGSYSTCRVPGVDGPCVRVAFPLPNGYALVVMRPEIDERGALVLRSQGRRFGDAGFYFYVERSPGHGWARYLRALQETIRVFRHEDGTLRADHDLRLWGRVFLRLHYRMRHVPGASSTTR